MRTAALTLAWLVHAGNRTAILELDSDREIIAIDIECDIDIFGMQIRTRGIVKPPDFATGQDKATNGLRITRSAFQAVPKVNRA